MSRSAAILEAAWRDPVDLAGAFADEPFALALVSAGPGAGRWSYLLRRPERVLVAGPDADDPFAALRALAGPRLPPLPAADAPPFLGGVAGLLAYEFGARCEPAALPRLGAWPDLACGLYLSFLAFDAERRRVLAVGRGGTEAEAQARAEAAWAWLDAPSAPDAPAGPLAETVAASDGRRHEAAAAETVARIARGEIFQANIARRWSGRLRPGRRPFDLFARLARSSPAPYSAYLRLAEAAVVSNSPEQFLSVRAGEAALAVSTRPIKGTRPRGATAEADARLAADLSASAKDRAENLMIVDLMRNDLSRVCPPGSVRVPDLFRIESYANVHHMVSTVEGRLAPGAGPVDLIRAAFPAGSITGAPKVQAMKVVAELEPPRGPYCGALFWMGLDGAMESSVLIRTVAFERDGAGWALQAGAGGGIVADSEPAAERRETEDKIAAILAALTGDGR